MPPRLTLNTRTYRQLHKYPYVCRACLLQAAGSTADPAQHRANATWEGRRDQSTNPRRTPGDNSHRLKNFAKSNWRRLEQRACRRYASNGSLASSTAINAPTSVPHRYRELHQRLLAIQEAASSYVNRSRLQLALRSLESARPTVRVAFLGLGKNGPSAARRLARVLLSDALSEEETWERELLAEMDDGRSLLLKYGDPDESVQSSPLVKTMNVPSRYLERHNIEILITPLNADDKAYGRDVQYLEDAILVPSLTTPNTSDGRVGFVRFPVHKSVIVAEGISGAIEYGRFPSFLADGKLINAAVNVPLLLPTDDVNVEESRDPSIDIELGAHALDLFRVNKANGAQFSDEWQRSRLPVLSAWIVGSTTSSDSGMDQAVQDLIYSVISSVSVAVSRADNTESAATESITVQDVKRVELQSAIGEWSAEAHRDLQTNLDTAFASSASWKRTAWWRLFWRIDDVSISASDVLRQSWLTDAEQRLAFLSGRISEASLASVAQLQEPAKVSQPDDSTLATPGELTQMPSLIARRHHESDVTPKGPWPQAITLSRQYMLSSLVPDLHRKAQALLISALSTSAGSAALATWFYFATTGVALYESGAILSLGLVWSLRRLQKKWGAERDGFASAAREDARRVLGEVENHLRNLVQQGGRVDVHAADAQSRTEAREAAARCQKALEKFEKPD